MDVEQIIANDPYLRQVMPMPESFYTKFNIPKPKIVEFKEALHNIRFPSTEGKIYVDGNLDK